MSSLFNQASLVIEPAVYETSKVYATKPFDGSGDLTFTRSNDTATRVGPDGLIEKVRTNLFPTGSALLATGWTSVGATLTAGQTDPNGGTTALRVQLAAGGSPYSYILQSFTGSAFSYARSVFIKGATAQAIRIVDPHSGAGVTVNLTTDWQRFTAVGAGSGGNFGIQFDNDNDDAAKDFTIAFVQIETGDIATDYIATTSAAVSVGPVANVPRLDYLGSSCPRLILEPQRQNAQTFSEQHNNATWGKLNLSVTANAGTSPDGYANADLVYPDTGVVNVQNYNSQTRFGLTIGASYTQSVFLKASGFTWAVVDNADGGSGAWFNLVTGTIGTVVAGSTAKIENYGNGWYRCSVTSAPSGTTGYGDYRLANADNNDNVTANGTDGILAWGFQFEAGAYATSYIPTLGAAVTRGGDDCGTTSLQSASLIGATAGTFFLQTTKTDDAVWINQRIFLTSTVVRSLLLDTLSGQIRLRTWDAASAGATITTSGLANGLVKYLIKWDGTNIKAFANGVLVGSSAQPSYAYTTYAALESTAYSNNTISQLLFFPTALSDADCIALTA